MIFNVNLNSTELDHARFSVENSVNEDVSQQFDVSLPTGQRSGNKATMRRFKSEMQSYNIMNHANISGSTMNKICDKLRNLLSEQELLYLVDRIDAGGEINNSLFYRLASVRGSNKSFSSKEITDIANILSEFDGISKIEINEDFWTKLQESTFNTADKYFTEQNTQVNYEAQRIFSIFQNQTELEVYLDPNSIRQLFVDGLIIDEHVKDRFWESIFKIASIYEQTDKIFPEESWEENYEIAYCTQGFEKLISQANKDRFKPADLENALNMFPKTCMLNIVSFYNLFSPSIASAISRCSKYLKSFTCKGCAGRSDGQGLTDYFGIQQDSIDALSQCKELRFVDIKVDPWCCPPADKVRRQLETDAPWITSLNIK